MTGNYEPSALGFVREHVEQIMRTGTTDGVTMKDRPLVLITYRGAKTGKVRKTPVMRIEHEGRYAAVASNGAQPTNPQWYPSLLAEPVIELQDRTVTRQYRAREVFGDEKTLWWRRAVAAFPDYADYQRKISYSNRSAGAHQPITTPRDSRLSPQALSARPFVRPGDHVAVVCTHLARPSTTTRSHRRRATPQAAVSRDMYSSSQSWPRLTRVTVVLMRRWLGAAAGEEHCAGYAR